MKQLGKTAAFILNVYRDKYSIEDKLISKYYNYISIEKNAKNIAFIAVNLEMIYSGHPEFEEILKRKMIQATEFLINYPYTDVCTIKNLVLQEKEDFVF